VGGVFARMSRILDCADAASAFLFIRQPISEAMQTSGTNAIIQRFITYPGIR
jgi:hypothetical protein